MSDFDAIFFCIYTAILGYHVFYFMVQYFVIKRLELFYYSVFLCGNVLYYSLFHPPSAFNVTFDFFKPHSGLEFAYAFITTWLYLAFISSYLSLNKSQFIYRLIKYYNYYNVVMIAVFASLGVLNIPCKSVFLVVSIITWPIAFTVLYHLWKINNVYSNVILWGTTVAVVFTLISYILDRYEIYYHYKFPFYNNIPTQIGGIIDLFILGYGLSLKAAEADKKLIVALQENQKLIVALQENQKLLETERGRFARDLHDGLGGLLSSVKFSFSNMKESIILTAQQGLSFEQSLNKLDSGIAELRRIAHNMMPENLQQFGLNTALKDFCITIQQGTGCNIHYECFGMKTYSFNSQTDIAVYRIAQELVNNALKHAAAGQIIVQLQINKASITLTVEDNGKGFDKSILKNEKGSGWKSIESRINLLKGTLHIDSTTQGTLINIEIPIAM